MALNDLLCHIGYFPDSIFYEGWQESNPMLDVEVCDPSKHQGLGTWCAGAPWKVPTTVAARHAKPRFDRDHLYNSVLPGVKENAILFVRGLLIVKSKHFLRLGQRHVCQD